MRRFPVIVGIFAAALAGLILAGAAPANATHPVTRARIADADSRTFATASTTSRYVTMQLPSTVIGLQHWNFSDTVLGTKVTNLATGGCLGLPTVWTTIHPPIVQQPCANTATEYWRIVSMTTSTVMFRNVGRDGCIAIDATGSVPARLFLVPCRNDDRNQHFRLVA
jgi:hypothetical protein